MVKKIYHVILIPKAPPRTFPLASLQSRDKTVISYYIILNCKLVNLAINTASAVLKLISRLDSTFRDILLEIYVLPVCHTVFLTEIGKRLYFDMT